MKGSSVAHVGGIFAILTGLMYVVVGITFLLDSATGDTQREFLEALSAAPLPHLANHIAFGLIGVFMLAAVPAISSESGEEHAGWMKYFTTLALFGFAVTALGDFQTLGFHLKQIDALRGADSTARVAVVEASRYSSLDPLDVITFGAAGFWIFFTSIFALQARRWPRLLGVAGLVFGGAYWLVAVGTITGLGLLTAIAAALGGVLAAPIWLIWLGVRLRRMA